MASIKPIWKILPIELMHATRWPQKSFTITDQAGNPLTGFTIKMQVKMNEADVTAVKTLDQSSGFNINGNLVTFDAQVDIPVGVYVYDIIVTLADGHPYPIYKGPLTVDQNVTVVP